MNELYQPTLRFHFANWNRVMLDVFEMCKRPTCVAFVKELHDKELNKIWKGGTADGMQWVSGMAQSKHQKHTRKL